MINYRETEYKGHRIVEARLVGTRWDVYKRLEHLARADHMTKMVVDIRDVKETSRMPNTFVGRAYLEEHTDMEAAREQAKDRLLHSYYSSRVRAEKHVMAKIEAVRNSMANVLKSMEHDNSLNATRIK